MTIDLPQLLIDADIAEMSLYTLRGLPVSDLHLSVDAINQVGPFKDFLTHRSTFDYRRSQSQPALIDRKGRDNWLKNGSQTMTDRARAKVDWILENHRPAPLPDSAKAALRDIVRRVEKEKGLPLSEE